MISGNGTASPLTQETVFKLRKSSDTGKKTVRNVTKSSTRFAILKNTGEEEDEIYRSVPVAKNFPDALATFRSLIVYLR